MFNVFRRKSTAERGAPFISIGRALAAGVSVLKVGMPAGKAARPNGIVAQSGWDGDDNTDRMEMSQDQTKAPIRAARLREKARVRAIMGHGSAAANRDLALHLALQTSMGRAEAVDILAKAPAAQAKAGGLDARMNAFIMSGALRPGLSSEMIDAGWGGAFSNASRPESQNGPVRIR